MSEFQHSYALIIGINDYKNGISALKTAVSDATEIARILETEHDYTVTLLLNQAATLSQLRQVLEIELQKKIQAGDRFLFYFAGHGIALNGEDGPEGYLIPQNAKLGNVSTYLPMSQVNKALLQLPCRHFLGILDCCFAGAFRWSSLRKAIPVELVTIHKERYDRFIQDPAWQVLTSASHDQTALDAFNLKDDRGQIGSHSPFASALIEALEGKADAFPPAEPGKPAGDGVITASELYVYLRDRVEIATEARAIRQTPGIHCLNKHDKGEYIFLTPGHALNLPPAPPLDVSKNPYRGLLPFEEEHNKLFFGRNELIEKLQNIVQTNSLTVVLGASGCGKSSLVKAGLIPKLKQQKSDKWCILSPIRPGATPFQALNNALIDAQLPKIELQNQQKTLSQSIAVWAKNHPDSHLLIFIDKSEEIITLCQDEDERPEFFQQILTAIDAHRDKLRVVLSLRSDFETQVRDAGLKCFPTVLKKEVGNTDTELKKRWLNGQFIVPAMTRAELREAIEKPAEARVMYFQPHDLVEQLINEVADMPGALPLLSFALSELYQKYLKRQRDAQNRGITIGRALTQEDYQALGGVIQSLTQRADEEYQALVQENPAYSQVIRHVMLRMVALAGGELARRQVPLSELEYPPDKNSLVKKVIEHFSTARLLVKGQDAEGSPYVEPAHDALVRAWQKLLNWVKEEKDLALQRRLTPSALEWNAGQHAKFLWNANPYLDVLNKEVLNSPDNNWLNQVETEFVQYSLQKRRNSQRSLVATVTGVILSLSGFAIFAGYQWRQAEIGLIEALMQSSKANFTANKNSFDALIDALRANKRLQQLPWGSTDQKLQTNVLTTLAQSASWVREENRLQGHQNTVQNISFSPDGQMFATASYDRTVKLWRRDGSLVKTLSGHTDAVMSVSFSPDAKMIASGSLDGTVRLWDSNGKLIRVIHAHKNDWVMSISFSPDGKTIATASDDKTVKLWRLDGQLIGTLKGHKHWVWQVGFSPSGDRIITVSDDKTVKLWNRDGKTLIKTLTNHSQPVVSVDFSSDGQIFTTSSLDGTVKIWSREGQHLNTLSHSGEVWSVSISRDGQTIASSTQDGILRLWAQDGRLLDTWVGHNGPISCVTFSPDGKTLATVGNDNITKLWQIDRNWLTVLFGHQKEVNSLQFSPDGKRIASASSDGKVRIWNREAKLLLTLKADNSKVNAVSFSPDGNTIASGSDDGTIKIWGLDGQLQRTLKRHQDQVISVNFSRDGQTIASASADGTAKLWSLEGKRPITLKGHKKRVLSVAVSPDGQTIATAGDDTTVKLWTSRGQEFRTLKGHTDVIWSVNFSPDGTRIVTASDDQTIKLWHRDGRLITTLNGHTAAVLDASFSPDGKTIASASMDRTIKLWQPDGTLITSLSGHTAGVYAVNFSPDSKWLASAGADRVVLLWKVSDMTFQGLLKKGCNHIHNYLQTQPKKLKELCN
ncbi:nSTAND1 domain-containing NTPase [Microcoleus sp. D2_18a_D3]|uniref:nSTAND1 domain-containing NTPase n=1 Tax=Microcoleus sp. D2_18a_D3 TaxID=3055330 RepID=UPI002FCF4D34